MCIMNGFVLNAYSILTAGLYFCEIHETLPSCGLVLQFKVISTDTSNKRYTLKLHKIVFRCFSLINTYCNCLVLCSVITIITIYLLRLFWWLQCVSVFMTYVIVWQFCDCEAESVSAHVTGWSLRHLVWWQWMWSMLKHTLTYTLTHTSLCKSLLNIERNTRKPL